MDWLPLVKELGSFGLLAFVMWWLTGRQTKSLDDNTSATNRAVTATTELSTTIKSVCKFDPATHICRGEAK